MNTDKNNQSDRKWKVSKEAPTIIRNIIMLHKVLQHSFVAITQERPDTRLFKTLKINYAEEEPIMGTLRKNVHKEVCRQTKKKSIYNRM